MIAALVLILAPRESAGFFIGLNIAILYAVLYLVQGLAIVDHYLRKAQIKPVLRGLIHGLILALPIIVFVIALGLVDIWADVRKVRGPVSPVLKIFFQARLGKSCLAGAVVFSPSFTSFCYNVACVYQRTLSNI